MEIIGYILVVLTGILCYLIPSYLIFMGLSNYTVVITFREYYKLVFNHGYLLIAHVLLLGYSGVVAFWFAHLIFMPI